MSREGDRKKTLASCGPISQACVGCWTQTRGFVIRDSVWRCLVWGMDWHFQEFSVAKLSGGSVWGCQSRNSFGVHARECSLENLVQEFGMEALVGSGLSLAVWDVGSEFSLGLRVGISGQEFQLTWFGKPSLGFRL